MNSKSGEREGVAVTAHEAQQTVAVGTAHAETDEQRLLRVVEVVDVVGVQGATQVGNAPLQTPRLLLQVR